MAAYFKRVNGEVATFVNFPPLMDDGFPLVFGVVNHLGGHALKGLGFATLPVEACWLYPGVGPALVKGAGEYPPLSLVVGPIGG